MDLNDLNLPEGGILLMNKPLTWTSFDIVAKVRNTLKIKKIGHAGTLDPLASGLLILCTGKKTKTIESIQNLEKEYEAIITLGATTPTYDSEFPPENIKNITNLTFEQVQEACKQLTGEISQFPPAYSAVKIDGKRAYDLIRKGIQPEIKSKIVNVYEWNWIETNNLKALKVKIRCSKGTYIRSLANDLGKILGVGGYLSGLIRTKIGEYLLENSFNIEDVIEWKKNQSIENTLI